MNFAAKFLNFLVRGANRVLGEGTLNKLQSSPLMVRILQPIYATYPEGSVVTILRGRAAGLKWKRYHEYPNSMWMGILELPVQEAIAAHLGPGSVFYDVGANAGFFSLVGSQIVGPSGEVAAFEPFPQNVRLIREQLEVNHLANVRLEPIAVGAETGQAQFIPGDDQSTGKLGQGPGGIAVNVTTLDAYAAAHRAPELIKLDVEGAEAEVLRGARELIRSKAPAWIIELHGPTQAEEVNDLLAAAEYDFFTLEGRPAAPPLLPYHHVLARKRA